MIKHSADSMDSGAEPRLNGIRRSFSNQSAFSMTSAIPCPPPMHMVMSA